MSQKQKPETEEMDETTGSTTEEIHPRDEMYMTFDLEPDEEITRLAREVINGQRGRGAHRRMSLKDKYDAVMAEVVRLRQNGNTERETS